MQSTRRIAKVSAIVFGAVVVGAILILNALPAFSGAPQARSELMSTSLTRLHAAPEAQQRMQAARWLGEQEASISSEMIQSMGRSLRNDTDPAVRSAVARSFGDLAAKQNDNSVGAGANEPQMLEVLSAAYTAESNASVRARIITAAGQFKDPDALTLINKGLVDTDPGVREAAQMAKLQRQRKLLVVISG